MSNAFKVHMEAIDPGGADLQQRDLQIFLLVWTVSQRRCSSLLSPLQLGSSLIGDVVNAFYDTALTKTWMFPQEEPLKPIQAIWLN